MDLGPSGSGVLPSSRPSASIEPMWLLFSLEGRIPRLYYWLGHLGLFFCYRLLLTVTHGLNGRFRAAQAAHAVAPGLLITTLLGLLAILGVFAVLFWISFSLVVKRWHARGRSWAWALIGFVPLAGWLWQGIECGFMEGTLGPNAYGPSPKGITGVTYGDALAETFS